MYIFQYILIKKYILTIKFFRHLSIFKKIMACSFIYMYTNMQTHIKYLYNFMYVINKCFITSGGQKIKLIYLKSNAFSKNGYHEQT